MLPVEDIVGHQSVLQDLRADLTADNVAHAYLFVGQAHLGKFTIAKRFAEALLLQGVPLALQPATRQSIYRLAHPDLFVLDRLWIDEVNDDADVLAQYTNISQDHRRKSGAKTNTISIDDVRVLQERLHEIGTGRYRCCLIRSVERMQTEAVNALLKIVEEPPTGLVFLLTADDGSAVLPTLLSRCRVLHCKRLPPADLRPLVAALDDTAQDIILAVAAGAPGTVLTLRNDPDALRSAQLTAQLARNVWQSASFHERLKLLRLLEERGPEADALLLHLALELRRQPAIHPEHLRAFHALVTGLKTNASRPLIIQRFALNIQR